MAKNFESLRGMDDVLPSEAKKWQWLEKKAHHFFSAWGFEEIRTPAVESTGLFSRSIGETTDIVHKEMYSFKDRGDRELTLRPEMTASVARSVIQHHLSRNQKNLFLYYMGSMFRAERPQAGRKRQFHQIGAEIISDPKLTEDGAIDVLMIKALYQFLKYLHLGSLKVKLNDLTLLSGPEGKEIRNKLRDYFETKRSRLDEDSVYRLDKNVLRIFDSKDPKTQQVAAEAPWDEVAPLDDSFQKVLSMLREQGIEAEVDRTLVRGLDYYTGVVFEITAEGLGAQDAIAGGGRYNNLYSDLGGPDLHCTGFSLGVERLMMAIDHQSQDLKSFVSEQSVYVALLSESHDIARHAQEVACNLGERGFFIESLPHEFSLSKHLKKANKLGCRYMVIVGEEEFKNNEYKLKNMQTSNESNHKGKELISYLCEQHYQEMTGTASR